LTREKRVIRKPGISIDDDFSELGKARVVPAKAGTHTSRIFDSSVMLPRLP
jgi:hypothetical protein